jgi:hypothetical protein
MLGSVSERRQPGAPIVLRQLFQGRVWSVSRAMVVEDVPARLVLWMPPGVRGQRPEGDLFETWTLRDHVYDRPGGILRVREHAEPYSVLLFGVDGAFRGWYVNLEDPLIPTDDGWEFEDHLLDVWIESDRTWRWLDEDELEEAVARGIFAVQKAAEIRAAGRRALERVLRGDFDAWLEWRPSSVRP